MWLSSQPTAPRVLHVAPETVLGRRLRESAEQYVSIDLDGEMADVQADITEKTPFADGHFDLIVCSHVLEHIDDDWAAMAELRRLVSNDGRVLILVPIVGEVTDEDPTVTDPSERTARFGQWNHVRQYGTDLVDRLKASGFVVEEALPQRTLTAEELDRYGVHADEILFVAYPT